MIKVKERSGALRTILTVEDDVPLRETIRAIVASNGIEMREAANGMDALNFVKTMRFHAILCDIKMPGMDGLQFAAKLKEEKIESPLIFYSAYADKEILKQIIKLGAFDFIEKPFKKELLLSVLEEAFLFSDNSVNAKLLELGLKSQEVEILKLVLKGLGNKEIASLVNLTEQGVKYHMTNLLQKFGTVNRVQLNERVRALIGAK